VQLGRSFKSFVFVGLRGVGKTVLLNVVTRIAEELGFKSLHVEVHDGKTLPELLVPGLRALILGLDGMARATEATRRAIRVFRSFIGSKSRWRALRRCRAI
jgi:hypothetical protein